MDVEIRPFGSFRHAVGQQAVVRSSDGTTDVQSVLPDLERTHRELAGSLLDEHDGQPDAFAVVLNGRNIVHEEGLDTPLADGDVLGVAPPLAGGT